MGCAQGKCCRCYRACCFCCHYQPSDDEGGENGELDPCRVHDGSHHPGGGHVLTGSSIGSAVIPSHHLCLRYSSLTQQGHYPDSPDRENQDSFCVKTQFQGNHNLHFFGVFDGHGQFGTQCANFVRDRLVDILSADIRLLDDPMKAYNSAFLATNSQLHDSEIDDAMSGTTAITVFVSGDTLYIANVGDSRAVAGVWNGDYIASEELSLDQTPFRRDEYERVKLCGARVLSFDQVEGIKDPNIQNWGDEESNEGDPPRLWVQNGMYPGTAFTRSVGDSTAEDIGVIAVPEIMTVKITPDHLFFVVASDGVFEFLSSQAVVDMVARFADPRDACSAIAAESYKLWLEQENRTDDITIIIVHIKDLSNSGSGATDEASRTYTKASLVVSDKGQAECCIFRGSETCHLRRGNFSELQSCPPTIPNERSPACVAPSLTHSSLM